MKKTNGALLTSVLALALCFVMLLGTTWAWFTDEVTSAQNIIQAGTLKIDLIHVTDAGEVSIKANPEHKVFNYNLWEPGYTQMETLKIVNTGSLGLKYRLSILAYDVPETAAKLADVIDVYMLPTDKAFNNFAEIVAAGIEPVGTLTDLMTDLDGAAYGVLLPVDGSTDVALSDADKALLPTGEDKSTLEATIALHMQETAGNEYQGLTCGDLYLTLVATQLMYENDSFDNTYDENSEYPLVEPIVLDATTERVTMGGDGKPFDDVIPDAIKVSDVSSSARDGLIISSDTFSTVFIDNVQFDGKTAITTYAENVFVIRECDFTLAEDGKLLVVASNLTNTAVYVEAGTVRVNGQPLTNENINQYIEGTAYAIVMSF